MSYDHNTAFMFKEIIPVEYKMSDESFLVKDIKVEKFSCSESRL